MAPIRVGMIGLSTTSTSTSWGAHAHLPYLQSDLGKQKYEIVALCNSSKDSAKKSIEQYKLPSSTKTYDSPEDLAQDPDVDLIVNTTGVDKHYQVLLPAVEAGKNVYTELPLASNMKQMKELLQKAESNGIKTVFGMQGQTHPLTKLIKETIAQDKIGKVLSSNFIGTMDFILGSDKAPQGFKSFAHRSTGANMMTVGFLHSINFILAALGELSSYQSILGNMRPDIHLFDPKDPSKTVETIHNKDTPDQCLLQGRLEQNNAVLSYHLRCGGSFAGQPQAVWHIYGQKGEIRITNPSAGLLDIVHAGLKIELHEFGKGDKEATELKLPEDAESKLEHPSQNVGRIYEAYAAGKQGGDGGYPDWKLAMKRHEMIDEIFRRADEDGAFAPRK